MHIAENTELPIILYNVPGRTNLDLSAKTIARLCECEKFIALKESSYDIPGIMEKMRAADGRLAFYSGNDDMVYVSLALGFEGVISVLSNVKPDVMSDLVNSYFKGDLARSRELQLDSLPLIRALFSEVSPIPCKYAMAKLGLCQNELRLPLIPASESTRALMDAAL